MNSIDVIGFGLSPDDLTEKHKSIIKNADLIAAGKRHLELLEKFEIEIETQNQDQNKNKYCGKDEIDKTYNVSRETFAITKDIKALFDIIKDRAGQGKRVVVIASGDPLFHGIGTTLINEFGKEKVNIYPNISSVSAAFASIKESWHDAEFISLHGNSIDDAQGNLSQDRLCQNNLFQKETLENHRFIAILTDHKKTPSWIAESFIEKNISDFQMYVFENLGADNQNISFYDDIREAAEKTFLSPNIVVLKRREKELKNLKNESINTQKKSLKYPLKIYSGMDDELFIHEKGLITKSEVRAVVLSKLELISDDHIFWDLGAGSGSVSIEVSKFIPNGKIFAVEKNEHRISDIKKNIERFGLCNADINIVHGSLPDVMNQLPDPDRIFIGGGGVDIANIIKRAGERLKFNGIMVINTVLIQTMNQAVNILKEMKFHVKLIQVQVSVSKEMPFGERLEALNPVWIIAGKKFNN